MPTSAVDRGLLPARVVESRPWDLGRDPLVLLAVLGLLAVIVVVLQLAQPTAAVLVVAFFATAVLVSPSNGLVLLFLLPPLFNGEDARAYFYLLEVLVYLTLASGLAAHWLHGRRLGFPYAPVFILFLISTVISVPLNFRETLLQLQVASWREILEGVRRADLTADMFYLRTVFNTASGIALYVLAVNAEWNRDRLLRLMLAVTLLSITVNVAGLVSYCFPNLPRETFLTLSFGTAPSQGFAGLGFNVSYFAQYSVAYLPLIALVLVEGRNTLTRALAFGATLLGSFTALLTYQRGAWLALAVVLGLLLLAARVVHRHPGMRRRSLLRVTVIATTLILVGVLFVPPIGSNVFSRVNALWHHGDEVRTQVLATGWQMLKEYPLLGVGTGRFAYFFRFYSARPEMQFGSWSTHNLYAQFLAEQGALGLLSFLGVVILPLGRLARAGWYVDRKEIVVLLLISIAGWLVYGGVQYTFLMRSMQIYFWCALGLLVALSKPDPQPSRLTGRVILATSAILVIAFAARLHSVAARPVPAGYTWGLYDAEPEGVRWTRGGAVVNLIAQGSVLRLDLACPRPAALTKPQVVYVSVSGSPPRRIFLTMIGWTTVDVPIHAPRGSPVVLRIQVDSTFVPATFGASEDTRRLGVLLGPIRWQGDRDDRFIDDGTSGSRREVPRLTG